MRITLKLFATLRDYLPKDTDQLGAVLEVPERTSPEQVLQRFQVPPEQVYLVLINGVYVEPDGRSRPVLKDGDVLAVWPPVAGG
jgi:molybdopterin converting factor small subunit